MIDFKENDPESESYLRSVRMLAANLAYVLVAPDFDLTQLGDLAGAVGEFEVRTSAFASRDTVYIVQREARRA